MPAPYDSQRPMAARPDALSQEPFPTLRLDFQATPSHSGSPPTDAEFESWLEATTYSRPNPPGASTQSRLRRDLMGDNTFDYRS